MKTIKCIKCGLRFKDRNDDGERSTVYKVLCMKCSIIWKFIGVAVMAVGRQTDRYVSISLEDVVIKKGKEFITFKTVDKDLSGSDIKS